MSYNVNAKPCFLNGCTLQVRSDGSTLCTVCGLFSRPNTELVNALLRANAGGKEYHRMAAVVLNQARLPVPPTIAQPSEPPVYVAPTEPSFFVVIPLALAIGSALGLLAVTLWRHLL